MSTDVSKVQVLQITKVRTSFKGDGSWIRGSSESEERLEKLRKPEISKKPDNLNSAQSSPVTSPTHLAKSPLTSEVKRLENTREYRPLATKQNSYVLSAAKKFEPVTPPVSSLSKKAQSNPATRFEETSANVDPPAESSSEPALKTTVASKEILAVTLVDPPKEGLIDIGPVDSDAPVEDHDGASSELDKDSSPKAEAKPTAEVPVGSEKITIEENTANPTAESKPAINSQTGQLVQVSAESVLQNGEPERTDHDPEPLAVEAKEPVEAKEDPILAPAKDEAVGSLEAKIVTSASAQTEMNGSNAVELAADTATEPAALAVEVNAESSASSAAEHVPVDPAETPEPIVITAEKADTEAVIEAVDEVAVADDIVEPAAEPIVEATDEAAVEAVVEVAVETAAAEDVEPAAEAIVETVVEIAVKTAADHDVVQPAAEPIVGTTDNAAADDAVKTAADDDVVQPAAEVIVEDVDEPVVEAVVKDAVKTAAFEDVVQPAAKPLIEAVEKTAVENVVGPVVKTASASEDVVQPAAEVIIEAVAEPTALEPAAEVVAETIESPTQSTPRCLESQPNQQPETISKANSPDNVVKLPTVQTQRHTPDGRAVCSFCDRTIDGNIKITISYPPMYSHPECFKCGVCAKALGDMLTTMFLHGQMVHCDSCFAKTL